MILDLINDVIGLPPVGWEFVTYVIACVLFIVFFAVMANVFLLLFRKFWRW